MINYEILISQIINFCKGNKNITIEDIKDLKRFFAKENKLSTISSNISLLKTYRQMLKQKKISKNLQIESVLKKRAIRSSSGIVAIQVLTKPFSCPGKCIFCPNDPSMPKSYIKSEPGAMRALLNHFDPLKQVYNRLTSLTLTGHKTDKIEMIVLGGTWDVYPKKYKIGFIKGLYDACNNFNKLEIIEKSLKATKATKVSKLESQKAIKIQEDKFNYVLKNLDKIKYPKTIEESIKLNERAKNRIIGLTIETRPEYVTDENCKFWRQLGVTRLEIGIQSMFDDVLKANKRGHNVQQFRLAIHKLRQYGFKFCVHVMPGLYKSNYKKDLETFEKLYSDFFIKPDEIKFYPTSVIPSTELFDLFKKGKYKPLETKDIKKLIKETFSKIIPPYTRIKRLIRDIPANEIVAGSNITNLSQIVHDEIKKKLKSHKAIKLKSFYGRLYEDYKLFSDLKQFIKYELKSKNLKAKNNKIKTFVIGKNPDLKSYRNFVSLDTRSREIRNRIKNWNLELGIGNGKLKIKEENDVVNLILRKYESSVGMEYFISFEDELGYLYGFVRLLLPTQGLVKSDNVKGLDEETAIVRELHIYGNIQEITNGKLQIKDLGIIQHKGFGKQLMEIAEKISKNNNYKKLSVIAGVGVRQYYQKIGYKLIGTYMVKKI